MTNIVLSLLSAETLAAYTQAGFWRAETIYATAAGHAARAPESFAVRDRRWQLSYRELIATADLLSADLASRGVRAGQRVAVWLPSCVETLVALLACSRNGYVCCPSLHRDHTVGEIKALVERMDAAAVIAQPGYGADADRHDLFSLLGGQGSLKHVYRLTAETTKDGVLPFVNLVKDRNAILPPPNGDANRIIYLPFTSGTTGLPKGVMHSDNTLLASARALANDWNFTDRTRIYTLSPVSHNLGLGAFISSIAVGGQLITHDLPRGQNLYDRLLETDASFLFGVPTHAIDLLNDLRARKATRLGSVTGFRISGAAATPRVLSELMRYGITPQSGYGMTETCSHQYTLPTDDPTLIAETCGRSCPGFEVRIWLQDDPDAQAPIGEIGQIGGRGASLMLGYFNDQETTESSFNSTGWFMTGDLGWIDENGFLRITGRKKDLIIRGGHNIYPVKIETLAMQHPAVDKAVAFAVPDERLGEKVCLAVVRRAGQILSDEDLLQHLDAVGLSKYDMPEFLVDLQAVPLTASGKILKRDLAERLAAGTLALRAVKFQPRSGAAS
jgi:acyl-CoA synthetase